MLLQNLISNTRSSHNLRKFIRLAFPVIFTLIVILPYAAANWDPYEVLGVQREASLEQIKRAYRDLARKLHPDKSNTSEDDGGRRFIELNKAFDILKDPSRRSRYDQHGDIDENRHSRGYHSNGGGGGGGYHRAARENWSAHNGFRTFTFYSSSSSFDSYYRKKSITSKQYYSEYIKESKHRPFLIFFYADICPTCSMIEPTWIKLTEELAKYNIGSFAINVHREPRLVSELGTSSIPHIACLLDTQVYSYHQSEISLPSLVGFIKRLLPSNLVANLQTVQEQDRHIALGPLQNRLSAIIVSNDKSVKLRYLLLAYATRHYYKFGFVSTKWSEHTALFKQYNLRASSSSHILIFNERIRKPALHLEYQLDNFNTSDYINQLLARPFLKLPRLSSQERFDDLCLGARPTQDDLVPLPLCVILFASTSPSSVFSREKMLEFMELNNLERDARIKFVYLDSDRQGPFTQALIEGTKSNQPGFLVDSISTSVILIKRHPSHSRKAQYQWLSARWNPKSPDEIDRAKIELYQYISAYKAGVFQPKEKVVLGLLVDEEGPSLFERVYTRCVDILKRSAYYLRDSLSALMILVGCALMTSLFLYKSPVPLHDPAQDMNRNRAEAAFVGSQYGINTNKNYTSSRASQQTPNNNNKPQSQDADLKIMELKAETYNGMVRLLKPGFRSIILLTDQAAKDKLVASFKKAVRPYRRNKTLLFGYLCLDKNLLWYKSLLERLLGCENLNVNKKNCIGTVLSLNGFKKYLRVYHAKHHEIDYYNDQTDNDGSFLGFDDRDLEHAGGLADSEEAHDVVYTEDNLLDKLPIWLDKMFDGLTKRYFVDQWPENIIK